jgi:hypothetical protein
MPDQQPGLARWCRRKVSELTSRSSVICETEELGEVPSMLFRNNLTTKRPSRLRSVAIFLAVFATWAALSVLTYQDGPDDNPLIVSLLSK